MTHPPAAGVLSLGSNLGDRLAHLQAAVDALRASVGVTAVSGVWETDPVGGPVQDRFLNAIVLSPTADPEGLLAAARAAESARERVRGERWGPRTLDVDVIAAGSARRDTPELTVPHPRAHLRAFVLAPWLDVDPDAELPGRGSVGELLAAITDQAVRRTARQLR